jgi:excisionase family DNA binding protein
MQYQEELVSARQLSLECGYTERTIRRWVAEGILPALRDGYGRVHIPRAAAEAHLERRRRLTPV